MLATTRSSVLLSHIYKEFFSCSLLAMPLAWPRLHHFRELNWEKANSGLKESWRQGGVGMHLGFVGKSVFIHTLSGSSELDYSLGTWEERGARNRRAQSCWEEKQLLLRVQCSAGKSKITGWGNQDNSSGMGHSHGMAGVGPAGLGLRCNGILGHGQGWEEPWGGWLGIVRLTCEQRMAPLKCEAWKRYGSEPFYKWWMREKKRKLYDFSITIFNFFNLNPQINLN